MALPGRVASRMPPDFAAFASIPDSRARRVLPEW
jgi:hypothetical protein